MSAVIVVAGATGLVGAAAVEHFASRPGWQVIAVSRRAPAAVPGVSHLPLDLTDAAACRAAFAGRRDVTHVLFAALYEKPDLIAGWQDPGQMQVNLAMLRNLLDAVEAGGSLRHLTLMQGTKAYGAHVEPAPVPLKERWPRHPHANFYWLQEDLLRARRAAGAAWRFTILRPQAVLGHAVASPMNAIATIGVFAALLRELGEPLVFPGGGRCVNGASDSRLIAAAAEFAATNPIAADETYNVVNGDVLVWHDVWPAIARHFGMAVGPARALRLAEWMPRHEDTWARIVARHGLRPTTIASLLDSSTQFSDRAFAYGIEHPVDTVMSPIKLRRAGFTDCLDTEDAIRHWLERMQRERLLPG